MNEKNKKNEPEVAAGEPKQPKFRTWAYWADVVKWFIALIGVVVDHVKENKFPRKDDYRVV